VIKFTNGRWFSPASSTTKTGRHDMAEILLKMALKHQKSNLSKRTKPVDAKHECVPLSCKIWLFVSIKAQYVVHCSNICCLGKIF